MANCNVNGARVSGYLEKKSKLRIVSPWKKYWFVLEGRLLLYYRSKDEYEALSPCKGSINLCPPCNVKPVQSVTGVFQIECRANTIILRAEDRSEQERWMQALLAANAQFITAKPMSHFRYSLDDLPTQTNKTLSRQNSMPYRTASSPKKDILERFQKIGAQTYRVGLGTITKFTKRDQKSDSAEPSPTLTNPDQYSIINEENSIDVNVENEHYVKTADPDLCVENDQYETVRENTTYCQIGDEDQVLLRDPENLEHLYERISKDSKEETVENTLYVQEYIEYDVIDKMKEFEDLYEDPDTLKKGLEAPHPSLNSEDAFSQTSSTDELPKRKCRFKMFKQFMRSSKGHCQQKLKPKSASFLRKVWRRKTSSLDSEVTYETVDYRVVEKQTLQDEKDLQMLQELQEILEQRKHVLQEKLNRSEQKSKSLPALSKDEKIPEVSVDKPDLPPRQSRLNEEHPSLTTTSEVKSIDEILLDLDKEKSTAKLHKVKDLIEKFNDLQNDDDVVLRKKPKPNFICHYGDDRNSDGLNKLLEELSKVTCAPILTPGATCSLITHALTDEELLEMIPIRRRRLSDLDYDIPRPHRSLQLHDFSKDSNKDAITATRFFGPILNTEKEKSSSMDPDSLEMQGKGNETKSLGEDFGTYHSHNYKESEDTVHVEPKSIVADCGDNQNHSPKASEDEEKTDELFIDSLEPIVEASTVF